MYFLITRMVVLLMKILGKMPEVLQQSICWVFGRILYYLVRSKRNVMLSNLYTVFPDKSDKWRRKLAKVNCSRWVETVWFCIIGSVFDKEDVRKRITLDSSVEKWFDDLSKNPRASVALVPHLNLLESITWLPACSDKTPNAGVVFRQLRNKFVDNWVHKTRERFGLQLISRKRGAAPLQRILADNGVIAILFDQSAGDTGILTTFFNKLASSTDLPGRLVEKTRADVGYLYIRRTGFGRGCIHYEPMYYQYEAKGVTLESNKWLADKLLTDSAFYENWLWMHKRWKTQYLPRRRFAIEQKRNCLQESLSFNGLSELQKKTRVFIRMPNWLGDCIMAIPLLLALRKGRPDFELNLVVNNAFIPLLEKHNIGDAYHPLPQKGFSYFYQFMKLSKKYPETYILLTNSFRSDLESFLTGAQQRFGIKKQWPRPLLTNVFSPSNEQKLMHQVSLGEAFLNYFGLKEIVTNEPLINKTFNKLDPNSNFRFACFCGSANTPEKRWPVSHWIEFLDAFFKKHPNSICSLLGGRQDYDLNATIAANFTSSKVKNLTGQTDLISLENELINSSFVVSNDTGGMHLANALNIPVVVMYGPTPLYKAKPFFNSPNITITSTNNSMHSISPTQVISQIQTNLFI